MLVYKVWSSGLNRHRAILHSLIAGIYADYVDKNQRQRRDREEIVGEVPTDMRG